MSLFDYKKSLEGFVDKYLAGHISCILFQEVLSSSQKVFAVQGSSRNAFRNVSRNSFRDFSEIPSRKLTEIPSVITPAIFPTISSGNLYLEVSSEHTSEILQRFLLELRDSLRNFLRSFGNTLGIVSEIPSGIPSKIPTGIPTEMLQFGTSSEVF